MCHSLTLIQQAATSTLLFPLLALSSQSDPLTLICLRGDLKVQFNFDSLELHQESFVSLFVLMLKQCKEHFYSSQDFQRRPKSLLISPLRVWTRGWSPQLFVLSIYLMINPLIKPSAVMDYVRSYGDMCIAVGTSWFLVCSQSQTDTVNCGFRPEPACRPAPTVQPRWHFLVPIPCP